MLLYRQLTVLSTIIYSYLYFFEKHSPNHTLNVRIVKGCGIVTESEKEEYTAGIIRFKSSQQVAKEWLRVGLVSKSEYKRMNTILAKKYGISLDSFFCK